MGSLNTQSFPIGKSIDASDPAYSEYQRQLGAEVETSEGKKYRLVQAASADGITGRKKVYTFTGASETAFTVDIAGAEVPCGVQRSDQVSLGVGDLFWLQIAGVAVCTDDGNDVQENESVISAATGDVVAAADETAVAWDLLVGRAIADAVAADGDVSIRLRGGL